MAKRKGKNARRYEYSGKVDKKKLKLPVFLYIQALLLIVIIFVVFFLFFYFNAPPVYLSSKNPKQGDTVVIRVNSKSSEVSGDFVQIVQGESKQSVAEVQKLIFYKQKGSSGWVSFLGIDADQKPGDYQVVIDDSASAKIVKDISISSASFTGQPAVSVAMPKTQVISSSQAIKDIRKNDNPAISKAVSELTEAPYFDKPFILPLADPKISGFSFGQFLGVGATKIQHLGVDLSAPQDTNIYAANDGKIVATDNLSNYGKTIIIDHGAGIFSMYLHLNKFKVSVGQMVKRGDIIGLSGSTGYVSGPHLHFSIRVDGTRVDPLAFIKASQQIDNSLLAGLSNAVMNIIKY